MNNQELKQLVSQKGKALISVSLNTLDTFTKQDNEEMVLKNLINKVEKAISEKYDALTSRVISNSLSDHLSELKMDDLSNSIHLYISEKKASIFSSGLSIPHDSVSIGKFFDADSLLTLLNFQSIHKIPKAKANYLKEAV